MPGGEARVTLTAIPAGLEDIKPLRRFFLEQSDFQIRYEACHQRGWADYYLLAYAGKALGYGAIKGQEIGARDTIFEFFLMPEHRRHESDAFRALIAAAQPEWVECQSNDFGLFSMLCRFGKSIAADSVLFAANAQTQLKNPGIAFRKRREHDAVFEHRSEPIGDWVLDQDGRVVATGGFFTHYNAPYVDLYMEVDPAWRRRGLGSFLLQEVQKECRRTGYVPAARCGIDNEASMATLRRAGLEVCGFMLKGSYG